MCFQSWKKYVKYVRLIFRNRATWKAFFSCCFILIARVLTPLRVSHESNGDGTAPIDFCTSCIFLNNSELFRITAPPIISECPLIYFVVLWTTISAPEEAVSGNTATKKYCPRQLLHSLYVSSDIDPISKIFSVGFVGVLSIPFCGWQKSLLNKVEVSKISECKCNFVWFNISFINRYVPPYISSGTITWSPGWSSDKIACSAASPEAKVNPYLPSSSEARQASSAVRVGFPTREYSYPLFY